MKKSVARALSALLMLLMVVGMLPMAANAQDAAIVYVSPDGDAALPGESASAPTTLASALTKLVPGETTIYLAEGDYGEVMDFSALDGPTDGYLVQQHSKWGTAGSTPDKDKYESCGTGSSKTGYNYHGHESCENCAAMVSLIGPEDGGAVIKSPMHIYGDCNDEVANSAIYTSFSNIEFNAKIDIRHGANNISFDNCQFITEDNHVFGNNASNGGYMFGLSVKNCTFDGNGIGTCYAYGDILFQNTTFMNTSRGVNLGNTKLNYLKEKVSTTGSITFLDCTFESTGYAYRTNGHSDLLGDNADGSNFVLFKNCSISGGSPDDATGSTPAVVFRTSSGEMIRFENCSFPENSSGNAPGIQLNSNAGNFDVTILTPDETADQPVPVGFDAFWAIGDNDKDANNNIVRKGVAPVFLSASVGENGAAQLDGIDFTEITDKEYAKGTVVSFDLSPSEGYIAEVTVNDEPLEVADNAFLLTMDGSKEVVITFSLIPEPEPITLPFKKTVKGAGADGRTFELEIAKEFRSTDLGQGLTVTGNSVTTKRLSFVTKAEYTGEFTIEGTADQIEYLMEHGFTVSEKQESLYGWTFDRSVYMVKYEYGTTLESSGWRVFDITASPDALTPVNEITFENRYKRKINPSTPNEPGDQPNEPGDQPDEPGDPVEPAPPTTKPTRLGGADRIATAIEISKAGYDKADTVVLASGYSYPDALAGTSYAAAVNAPILLTDKDSLDARTLAEIERLGAKKVTILGGTAAISEAVEDALKSRGIAVTRLAGDDRYGTAIAIAAELAKVTDGKFDTIYLASGVNYPDALSISPVAAIEGNPVLFVPANGVLDKATADYINSTGCKNIVILGGTAAVGANAENSLKALGMNVERIYGTDRYATSLAIAKRFAALFTGKDMSIATGKAFPDALAGAVFAAQRKMPVVLVGSNVPSELAAYAASRQPETLFVFGGSDAVSDGVVNGLVG